MIGTCRAETLRCTVRRGLWAANSRGTLVRDVLGHLCLSLTGAALRHPKCKTPKGESSTHQRRTSHTKVYQCKHTHTPPHTPPRAPYTLSSGAPRKWRNQADSVWTPPLLTNDNQQVKSDRRRRKEPGAGVRRRLLWPGVLLRLRCASISAG